MDEIIRPRKLPKWIDPNIACPLCLPGYSKVIPDHLQSTLTLTPEARRMFRYSGEKGSPKLPLFPNSGSAGNSFLPFQEPSLIFHAPCISSRGARQANHAVAGHQDADGVFAIGRAGRPDR